MADPPSPVRAGYATVSSNDRNGILYVGDTPEFTLNTAGADSYEIRYWGRDDTWAEVFGTVVSSGAVSGTTLTPDAPSFGWNPGWYRLYLTGPVDDAVYGTSYGAYTFIVVRASSRFHANRQEPWNQGGGEVDDLFAKSALGIGTSRLQIGNASTVDLDNPYLPGSAPGDGYTGDSLWHAGLMADAYAVYAPNDPVRPWPIMCQFPNSGTDGMGVPEISSGNYLEVYCKTADLDGSQVFVRSDPGSVSGSKIRVYYPDSSTLVETHDNLGSGVAAQETINAASDYIKVFGAGSEAATQAATAIGHDYWQGVVDTVTYLWPKGVVYYEGPSNEPPAAAVTAHRMMLFQAAVHEGHPDAKATGPGFVGLDLAGWLLFLEAGGGDYCDEISTHMYNSQVFGEINMGRATFSQWFDLLEEYGQEDKPVWSTESTHHFISVYGSYQPRHARVPMLQTLLLEQFGVPRQRNQVWYDVSHGFWGYPAWLFTTDWAPNPQCALYRTLAEETWGQSHHHAIDFGHDLANHIFLGSVYKSPTAGTSTAVLVSHSALPDGMVELTVEGTTDPLTVVDAWGNQTTFAVTSGAVQVPVSDTPTYVRLPVGVDVYVSDIAPAGDFWGPIGPSVSQYARSKTSGVTPQPIMTDNAFVESWGQGGGFISSQGSVNADTVPDTAQAVFNSMIDVDRVVVFGPVPWQPWSTLLDFDIDTSDDGGSTWTTRETVTLPTPQAFTHASSYINTGCLYETYWDKQWIFDVKLPATVTCDGVRVYAREVSYGGEPNPTIVDTGYGQGNSFQHLCLQELGLPSATQPEPYTAAYAELIAAEPNLVRWYRLAEATGVTTAVDEVNAAHNGTYTITNGVGPTAIPGAVQGNTARQFINVGNLVVPHDTDLDFGDTFSIEMWHNVAGDTSTAGVEIFLSNSNNLPKLVWNIGTIRLYKGATLVAHADVTYIDGGWHHVVVTKDGADTHIYLDGVDVTVLDTNATFTNDTSVYTINWRGYDELALYDAVLSPSSVFDHYNAAPTPTSVPEPQNFQTPAPTVSGSANVDEQIQSSPGYWTAYPTLYEFQWQTSDNGTTGWANVGGATRSDYIIDPGDLGNYLRCRVTPANVVGVGSLSSSNVVGPVGDPIEYVEEPPPVVPTGSRKKDRRTQGGSKAHGRIRRH